MDKFEDCIIFQLAKAYQKAHGLFKKRLLPYGLTPIQHLILEALWLEDGISQKDIGMRLVLDRATLSGVVDRMSSGGWITKEQDPRYLDTLATAQAGNGQFPEAIITVKKALALYAKHAATPAQTKALEERLKLFEAKTAYTESRWLPKP